MKKKDLYILGGALLLALSMFILFRTGALTQRKPLATVVDDGSGVTVMLRPVEGQQGEARQVLTYRAEMERVPADAYVLITVGRRIYEPLPLNGTFSLSIDQPDGMQNVAYLEQGAIHMQSATCDNQKCVHQGTVSLENRDLRALFNQIICTPNQVVLDVLSADEASTLYGEKE